MDMMEIRRRVLLGSWKKDEGLPDEYQEVEYIECDNANGSSYIITDYIPTEEMTRLSMKYMRVKRPTHTYLFSAHKNFCYAEIRYSTRWYVCINTLAGGHSMDASFTKGTSLNEVFELSYLPDNLYINETVLPNKAYRGENDILPLVLFARINNGTLEEPHDGLRTYSFQIDKNEKLDLNLIPCYRKSDGEIGMYDTVSKNFFTNAGTGTFLKGSDVN